MRTSEFKSRYIHINKCIDGGMADTVVLETTALKHPSSSLGLCTGIWCKGNIMVLQTIDVSSILAMSTI